MSISQEDFDKGIGLGKSKFAMTPERRNEIAFLLIKSQMKKNGLRLGTNLRREAANQAQDIGISPDEAMAFIEPIVREMVEETFAQPEFRVVSRPNTPPRPPV